MSINNIIILKIKNYKINKNIINIQNIVIFEKTRH